MQAAPEFLNGKPFLATKFWGNFVTQKQTTTVSNHRLEQLKKKVQAVTAEPGVAVVQRECDRPPGQKTPGWACETYRHLWETPRSFME